MWKRFGLLVTAAVLVVLIPGAVAATTETEDTAALIPEVETQLLALAPLVVAAAALVLSPEASKRLKQLVPGLISIVACIAYWVVEAFPESNSAILAGVLALGAVSNRAYVWVDAAVGLAARGKGLNDVTGPGVVKSSTAGISGY